VRRLVRPLLLKPDRSFFVLPTRELGINHPTI
jgi:hypothetical protein